MPSHRKIGRAWLVLLFTDLAAVAGAYYTTLTIRFHTSWGGRFFESIQDVVGEFQAGLEAGTLEAFYLASAARIICLVALTVLPLYALTDLYAGRRFLLRRPVAWNIVLCNLGALAVFYAYFYLRRNVFHPRSFFATMLALNTAYAVLLRRGVDGLMQWLRARHGFDRCRTLVLGRSEEGDALCGYINLMHPQGLWLEASLAREPGESFDALCERLRRTVRENAIDAVLSVDRDLQVGDIMRLLETTGELGVATKVLTGNLDVVIIEARMPVDVVQGVPLLHFSEPARGPRQRSKVAWSFLTAAVTVLLTAPLQAAVAAMIKMTSRGPVFFVQERIGVDRRPFRMFKFRTMYDRAEERQAQVEEFNESGRGLFKMRDDPRVTPAGRFLRRFSLDELPQLYNVLRGEMVLVGPRPLPRRDFENYYEEWHYNRHAGMPGLTCLWQVSGRSNIDFHNMCILDVYYLRNQNWAMDVRIVLKTVWVVLFAKGAY